ncbi:MAG: GDYXXLXY domain-containing protein [Phototrophicaceae bacterium]
MNKLRLLILFGTLAVFLYLVNSSILSSENNIENGTVAYFELAPVDPRSLIQGDYMTLTYTIEGDANTANIGINDRGQIVVSFDDQQVAHFERLYSESDSLADNETVINFYAPNGRVRVGVDSFFFQEGQTNIFGTARYAEVRILEGGGVMLVHLADENFQTIVPE